MGKSALLAAWLLRRERAGAVVPHHFIRRGEYDWDDPAKLVGSLVAQIEERFPEQREPEADARMHPAARLEATLRRVSENVLVPRGERLVVLIDGLDEYDPPADAPGRDPLAAFLPRALPRGVRLLCASRPRHPYVDMLATRGAVQLDLDERACAADNEATVRAFWEQAAPELGLDAGFVSEAVASAEGNLQHAAMLRQHLAGLPRSSAASRASRAASRRSLASAWERVATDPAVIDGLGILCAAREALTLDELARRGRAGRASRRGGRSCAARASSSSRAGARARVAEYRLHHDSIRGQIAGAIGPAALRGHHRALAQKLATWPLPAEPAARRYALRHALLHRVEAGDWTDAWRLAGRPGLPGGEVPRARRARGRGRRGASGGALPRERRRGAPQAVRRSQPGRSVANRTGCAPRRRRQRRSCGTGCGNRMGRGPDRSSSCRFRPARRSCACGTWRRARALRWCAISPATSGWALRAHDGGWPARWSRRRRTTRSRSGTWTRGACWLPCEATSAACSRAR